MALLVVLALVIPSSSLKQTPPPNIVILLADDLGWGDLSSYGHPTSTTPHLDRMALEGLIFQQFYAASPVCSPSRAALLTGRYQTRSGVYPDVFGPKTIGGMPLNETTIAEGLKSVGYYSAIVGKWHLGVGRTQEYLPTNQGFDSFYGIPYSHDMCPCIICFYPSTHCFDFEECDPDVVPCPLFANETIIQQPVDLFTLSERYVVESIEAIKTAKAKSVPFFLYLAFQQTHNPQFSNERFTRSSPRLAYRDALSEMDWMAGEILQALKDEGIDNDTFVFFTSDNGPALLYEERGGSPGPLRCGKGTTWEGGQRMPAIARWPGKITPGSTIELATTLDIFPTVMKLAGAKLPAVTLDGVDMAPILFDNGESNRDSFMYYPSNPTQADGVFAVRWNQYKAHFIQMGGVCGNTYPDMVCRSNFTKRVLDTPLIYDLHADPKELFPLDSTAAKYSNILQTVRKMKDDFDKDMTWGESQTTGKGFSLDAQPCGKPGCLAFPSCCETIERRSRFSPITSSAGLNNN